MVTAVTAAAQSSFSEPTTLYLLHSSGNHLEKGTDDGGWIEAATKSNPQKMIVIPDGKGYYSIQVNGQNKFLAKSGQWNSAFIADSASADAKFSIEQGMSQFVKLRCEDRIDGCRRS